MLEPSEGDSLNDVGKGLKIVLKDKLDRKSEQVGGQSVVNKSGYLTELNSIPINSEADIGDF